MEQKRTPVSGIGQYPDVEQQGFQARRSLAQVLLPVVETEKKIQ
jgi:hypothetical protein